MSASLETKRGATPDLKRAFPPHTQFNPLPQGPPAMVPATASSAWGVVDECRAHFFIMFGLCMAQEIWSGLRGGGIEAGRHANALQHTPSSAPVGNSQCIQHTCVCNISRSGCAPKLRLRGVVCSR